MNWEMEILERELLGQPVRGLQYMLRQLSRVYAYLPDVTADGIFGERTLEAVMLFQKNQHPPVTGVVDRDTWNAIRDAWVEAERKLSLPRGLRGFPNGAVAAAGDRGEYLYLTQAMFHSLSAVLEGIEADAINGVQESGSVHNTRWLQGRANLRETGSMDQETWDALTRLYELFVVRGPERDTARPAFAPGRG